MSPPVKQPSNPQAVYNGWHSSMRNTLVIGVLSTAIMGFGLNLSTSAREDTVKHGVRIAFILIGLCMLMLSIWIGHKTNYDLLYYLDATADQLPAYVPVSSWRTWVYVININSVLVGTLVVITALYVLFFFNR
jgi:hypothetical protein